MNQHDIQFMRQDPAMKQWISEYKPEMDEALRLIPKYKHKAAQRALLHRKLNKLYPTKKGFRLNIEEPDHRGALNAEVICDSDNTTVKVYLGTETYSTLLRVNVQGGKTVDRWGDAERIKSYEAQTRLDLTDSKDMRKITGQITKRFNESTKTQEAVAKKKAEALKLEKRTMNHFLETCPTHQIDQDKYEIACKGRHPQLRIKKPEGECLSYDEYITLDMATFEWNDGVYVQACDIPRYLALLEANPWLMTGSLPTKESIEYREQRHTAIRNRAIEIQKGEGLAVAERWNPTSSS